MGGIRQNFCNLTVCIKRQNCSISYNGQKKLMIKFFIYITKIFFYCQVNIYLLIILYSLKEKFNYNLLLNLKTIYIIDKIFIFTQTDMTVYQKHFFNIK